MFDLGPHGFYIGFSYLAAILVLGGLLARAVFGHRRAVADLAALEMRGIRRRGPDNAGQRP